MKKVIGIIGTIGAGKDTAGDYLSNKLNVPSFQISSPLKDILKGRNEELTRENLVDLGTELASKEGADFLAKYIVERGPDTMIITGMRQLAQLDYLKDATQLTLISIDASPQIRFDRVKLSPQVKEAPSLEGFRQQEQTENSAPNVQRLFECMELANYTIKNEDSYEDFYAQLDSLIDKF